MKPYDILLLVVLFLFILAIYFSIKLLQSKNKVGTTSGRIIDIKKTAGEHITSQKLAKIEYNIDGKHYVSQNWLNVYKISKVGDRFQIKYYKDDPNKLFTITIGYVIGFLIGAFVCFAVYFVLRTR